MSELTQTLVAEHRLILRLLALLERNAPATAAGSYTDWQFYRDGIDFIRSYADRFHHAKEEEVLFAALVANGMPREQSPVAAMLMEHDQGRTHVAALEKALQAAEAGSAEARQAVAEHALAYAWLLREHIAKEDQVLYPLAERLLPATVRPAILAAYQEAEARTPGLEEHYRASVERYEQQ